MERDFKGVWIPKHIWLHPELSMLDKILLVEIDSLDRTERGCYASNKYLAEFCGCSESAVSKSISKLTKLGLLFCQNFDGRQRELKSNINSLLNNNIEPSKIYEAEEENLLQSNIINNTINKDNNINIISSKENSDLESNIKGQLFNTGNKPKKQGENQFITVIEKLSSNPRIRTALEKYLGYRRKKGLTIEQWETIVTRFKKDTEEKGKSVDEVLDAIEKCLMDGNMKLFYKEYGNNNNQQTVPYSYVKPHDPNEPIMTLRPGDFVYREFYSKLPEVYDENNLPVILVYEDGTVRAE